MKPQQAYVEGQGVSDLAAWTAIAAASVGLAVVSFLSFTIGRSQDDLSVALSASAAEDESKSSPLMDFPEITVKYRSTNGEHSDADEGTTTSSPGVAAISMTDSRSAFNVDDMGARTTCSAKGLSGEQAMRLFITFQVSYLSAEVVAAFADWLKGAYTMSIYKDFGLTLSQVSFLFVCTFFSSMAFGTIAGSVSDTLGRVRMCRAYCLIYAVSLVLTLCSNFYVLCFARILSGISTSLLATSFESWVITEHHARGFDPRLLPDTFSKKAIFGSASAVIAGFVAEYAVYLMGNPGPFLVPLPCLLAALFFMRNWPENYGEANVSTWRTLTNGWHDIRRSRTLQVLCLCEALYEGTLGVWFFVWTPALDMTNQQTPFGLVFAAFTICMVGGGVLARLVPPNPLLAVCHILGVLSLLSSALYFENKVVVLGCFLVYEVSTGVYNVAHPTLRSHLMADGTRSSVMSLFRLPMNLLVVCILLMNLSPGHTLWLLAVLQVISGAALIVLARRA